MLSIQRRYNIAFDRQIKAELMEKLNFFSQRFKNYRTGNISMLVVNLQPFEFECYILFFSLHIGAINKSDK